MKTSGILLHILQICTSYFIHLYLIIFNFFAFLLFQWNFYVRLQGVPISYPQLLLNLWVDFNENFRHSSTYIRDVHPKAMQLLYEIWLFSIVLLSPYSNEIFMLDFRGYPNSDILLHTLEMYIYTNAIWYLIIFNCFGFPYWKMDFVIPYLRVPITYPLSLLDLWMDFNETCVNQLQNGKI